MEWGKDQSCHSLKACEGGAVVQIHSQSCLSFPAAPSNFDPDSKESWIVPSCFAKI